MVISQKEREKKIYRVTLAGSIINMVLLAFKFVAGVLGGSAAMIADAVHSLWWCSCASARGLRTLTMNMDMENMKHWQPPLLVSD